MNSKFPKNMKYCNREAIRLQHWPTPWRANRACPEDDNRGRCEPSQLPLHFIYQQMPSSNASMQTGSSP
eukprot:7417201-Karenia_brevis.AAC.1